MKPLLSEEEIEGLAAKAMSVTYHPHVQSVLIETARLVTERIIERLAAEGNAFMVVRSMTHNSAGKALLDFADQLRRTLP